MKRIWLILFGVLAGCSAAIEPGTTADDETDPDGSTDERIVDDSGAPIEEVEAFALLAAGQPGDAIGRVDLDQTGNRVVGGAGAVGRSDPIDIALPATPLWVIPWEGSWVVVLETGQTLLVESSGGTTPIDRDPARAASVVHAPLVVGGTDGPVVGSVLDDPLLALFDDPLPDTRIVRWDDLAAALVQPTDRYPHGVFGDRIEAAAVQVINTESGREVITTFGPEEPAVIEAISPMFADLTGDGVPEVVVTQSNADVGAWLAVWSLDGTLVAESDPIGLGNRWRNQLAVAPVGPNGEIELMDVRTPHIGGTLQYFQLRDRVLEQTAGTKGFTSHRFGSRNIDLAIVADADGDGSLDVIIPSDDLTELGVVTRTGAGVEVARHDIGGKLSTNVAAASGGGGALTIAAGTENKTLRLWAP